MILSDHEIRTAIQHKKIVIDPLPTEEQYTTTALDLLLGEQMFVLKAPQDIATETAACNSHISCGMESDHFCCISAPQYLSIPLPPLVTMTCDPHVLQIYILPS